LEKTKQVDDKIVSKVLEITKQTLGKFKEKFDWSQYNSDTSYNDNYNLNKENVFEEPPVNKVQPEEVQTSDGSAKNIADFGDIKF